MSALEIIQAGDYSRLEQLTRFLAEIDSEFDPPISSRTPLADYVGKLLRLGRVIAVCEGKDIIGMAGFYCNDLETRTAFFSILAIKSSFRKHGLGRTLVEAVLRESCAAGMHKVRLETSAEGSAVGFHERMGFRRLDVATNRPGGRGVTMEYAFADTRLVPHGNLE